MGSPRTHPSAVPASWVSESPLTTWVVYSGSSSWRQTLAATGEKNSDGWDQDFPRWFQFHQPKFMGKSTAATQKQKALKPIHYLKLSFSVMIPRQSNQENKSKNCFTFWSKEGRVCKAHEWIWSWRDEGGEKVRGYVLDSFSWLGILKKTGNKIHGYLPGEWHKPGKK